MEGNWPWKPATSWLAGLETMRAGRPSLCCRRRRAPRRHYNMIYKGAFLTLQWRLGLWPTSSSLGWYPTQHPLLNLQCEIIQFDFFFLSNITCNNTFLYEIKEKKQFLIQRSIFDWKRFLSIKIQMETIMSIIRLVQTKLQTSRWDKWAENSVMNWLLRVLGNWNWR